MIWSFSIGRLGLDWHSQNGLCSWLPPPTISHWLPFRCELLWPPASFEYILEQFLIFTHSAILSFVQTVMSCNSPSFCRCLTDTEGVGARCQFYCSYCRWSQDHHWLAWKLQLECIFYLFIEFICFGVWLTLFEMCRWGGGVIGCGGYGTP